MAKEKVLKPKHTVHINVDFTHEYDAGSFSLSYFAVTVFQNLFDYSGLAKPTSWCYCSNRSELIDKHSISFFDIWQFLRMNCFSNLRSNTFVIIFVFVF